MNQFVVGKTYAWLERGFDPFIVLSRTAKTITVSNGTNTWRMLVRSDDQEEWVCDSSEPKYARDMFVSRAGWALNDGEYSYRIQLINDNGKEKIFGEGNFSTEDFTVHHAEWIVQDLQIYYPEYTVLTIAILRNDTVIRTL